MHIRRDNMQANNPNTLDYEPPRPSTFRKAGTYALALVIGAAGLAWWRVRVMSTVVETPIVPAPFNVPAPFIDPNAVDRDLVQVALAAVQPATDDFHQRL